jgi:hypothetical protein
MEWYYAVGEQQLGPISQQELQQKLSSGGLPTDTLVWKEGMGDWLAANTVSELAPPANSTVASPVVSSPATTVAPGSGYRQPNQPIPVGTVPTYLWQSICCVIFCCWPFAIPGIVFAVKVNPALAVGNLAEAQRNSDQAKMWCWISFGIGLLFIIVAFIAGMLEEGF